MSSAQLESQTGIAVENGALTGTDGPHTPFALRQQVAERLAAHRARRGHTAHAAPPSSASRPQHGRKAQIASAVADRYAHSQSYRSFLAAEAERSVHQADAVAAIATINARAIADAQQQLLADLDHWDLPPEPDACTHELTSVPATSLRSEIAGYTVRHAESMLHSLTSARDGSPSTRREVPDEIDLDECSLLDDEIAFRHDPTFAEAIAPLPLAANLIEFPRQLIAARKVRPRLAEGPLREGTADADTQLRIFEVDPAHLSVAASSGHAETTPEWSSILLAPQAAGEYLASDMPAFISTLVPQVAPIRRRLMAALVDGSIVLTTLLAGCGVFVETVAHVDPARLPLHLAPLAAVSTAAAAIALFSLLYLVLFFTFAEATPGMRYARIALCTFSDQNPSRRAIRRRILAMAIATLPAGLGLLWAFVDEDTLSWHDRLSQMYQRSY